MPAALFTGDIADSGQGIMVPIVRIESGFYDRRHSGASGMAGLPCNLKESGEDWLHFAGDAAGNEARPARGMVTVRGARTFSAAIGQCRLFIEPAAQERFLCPDCGSNRRGSRSPARGTIPLFPDGVR